VECVTYRLGPHTTADDPTRYVPGDELAAERERDPVATFGARMRELGLWTDSDDERVRAAALARMDLALERAEATPVPPEALFDNVYAELTPRQARQREEMLAARPGGGAPEGNGAGTVGVSAAGTADGQSRPGR